MTKLFLDVIALVIAFGIAFVVFWVGAGVVTIFSSDDGLMALVGAAVAIPTLIVVTRHLSRFFQNRYGS